MRSWERIDKAALEAKHGKKTTKEEWLTLRQELLDASAELGDGGDFQGSDEIDDEAIAVEHILETEFGWEA